MTGKTLADQAVDLLCCHDWPGNVRELENLIWRLMVLVDDAVIEADDIRPFLAAEQSQTRPAETGSSLCADARRHIERYFSAHGGAAPPVGVHARIMAEVEKPLIEETLKITKGNQLRAAEILGLNRNTLRRKIRDLEITIIPTRGR